MREGGTLSLVETKVVSIIVFSSVVFLLPNDSRSQALVARQWIDRVGLGLTTAVQVILMPYFFSKSVASDLFAPAEPTSRFSQYHLAIGEYLWMSPCEKEQFFSPFRGVHTVQSCHANDAILPRFTGSALRRVNWLVVPVRERFGLLVGRPINASCPRVHLKDTWL
jgi:hypothetical protein